MCDLGERESELNQLHIRGGSHPLTSPAKTVGCLRQCQSARAQMCFITLLCLSQIRSLLRQRRLRMATLLDRRPTSRFKDLIEQFVAARVNLDVTTRAGQGASITNCLRLWARPIGMGIHGRAPIEASS
jgi:hypothetical protein